MASIQIEVGDELFSFTSYQHWVNKAQSWFKNCGVPSDGTLSIDAKGRICANGKHMMQARDEDAFPVRVFAKR